MTAANHYTPAESERRGAAGGRLPMKRFFGRMTAELKENKAVLLVWGHSARCLPYRLPSIRWEEKWSGRIALFL